MITSLGQATVYALIGLYGQHRDIGAGGLLQLAVAALIVILLDELL